MDAYLGRDQRAVRRDAESQIEARGAVNDGARHSRPYLADQMPPSVEGASTGSLEGSRSTKSIFAAAARPQVIIVDDSAGDWVPLNNFLRRAGVRVERFDGSPKFLLSGRPDTPTCLIFDVSPGRDGLQFHQQLVAAGVIVPIVFVTAFGNVAMSVRAMKNGAVDFLDKPVRDGDLFAAVERALARDQAWCIERRYLSVLKSRYETLSRREREVMTQVVAGKINKLIAAELGIGVATVKVHRGKVMRKMRASSLPDLTRMADTITQNFATAA